MPNSIVSQFEEYESIVSGQILSLLDIIEEKIGINSFPVVFDEDRKFYIKDLQIFPSSQEISFKLVGWVEE